MPFSVGIELEISPHEDFLGSIFSLSPIFEHTITKVVNGLLVFLNDVVEGQLVTIFGHSQPHCLVGIIWVFRIGCDLLLLFRHLLLHLVLLFVRFDPVGRNQRQAQRIESAQQALQSSLVDDAGQGGGRRAIVSTFERDRHPSGPIRPTFVEVSRHFDLIRCRSIQRKFLLDFLYYSLPPMKPCSGGFIPGVWRGEGNGGTPAMLA